MTASISVFDLTKWSTAFGTTSATSVIAADLDPISPNDKLLAFQLGNTGIMIKIERSS